MHWHVVVLGYVSYLALVSLVRRDSARARRPLVVAAAVAWTSFAVFGQSRLWPALEVVIPSLILLAGYWLSGLLFVRPDPVAELWLQRVDHVYLRRVLAWYRRAPHLVAEYFELSYLLVYLAVPAGATTLVLGGHGDQIDQFWTVVLLAEFVCYGMLPWIQTRSPRDLEVDVTVNESLMRYLNVAIVNRASIRVNTVPSGHAAGALATALAVGATMPVAGAAFMVLAASIAAATVLGRYHYLVDTVLGVFVALAAYAIA